LPRREVLASLAIDARGPKLHSKSSKRDILAAVSLAISATLAGCNTMSQSDPCPAGDQKCRLMEVATSPYASPDTKNLAMQMLGYQPLQQPSVVVVAPY
jgi:hypothetical protein